MAKRAGGSAAKNHTPSQKNNNKNGTNPKENNRSSKTEGKKGRLALAVVVSFAVFAVVAKLVLEHHASKPLFDDEVLHRLANEASLAFREKRDGILTLEDMFTNVTRALQQEYPDHIFTDNEWVFNCAGGFKTGMLILHASLTEYVIFWGSAVHTVGMSGRHAGEFHDFLMTGSFGQWKEGTVHKKLYQPGDHVYHGRWRGSVVELAEDTWMLEHMVGIIPWSLPFGLADSVLSNQDFITVGSSLWTYARLVGYELLLQGKI